MLGCALHAERGSVRCFDRSNKNRPPLSCQCAGEQRARRGDEVKQVPSSRVRSHNYKHYVLGVLTIILLFNSIDRIALGILLQLIKVDFDLSDTQLGLLTGIAFALFYAVMGVPIARWADAGNRVTIIAVSCVLWSAAVGFCGLATSFVQLLMIRVVVAVGEAGCLPPAFSLMADYFNRAERPRAAAIYGLGGTFSAIIGYSLAGWLSDHYGWRLTFAAVGVPGVLLGLLAWLTLKEPRCERSVAQRESAINHPTAAAVCAALWSNVTFRRLLICLSGLLFFNIGIGHWLPAFFIRSHGYTIEQVGVWLAIAVGGGGLLGAYVGGELASRFAMNNESLQLRAVAIAACCAGGAAILAYLTPSAHVAFALIGLHIFGLAAINGPLFATMQTLIPERMRAMAFAIAFLVGNLIGMGLGPLTAGALSDLYQGWAHDDSLRYALLTLAPGYAVVAWCAWRGSNSVAGDLADVAAGGELESAARPAPVGAK